MLRSLDKLDGFKIAAKDGEIGKIVNFYFDDREWKIRYLVVNTGNWLTGRKVLISPKSSGKPDFEKEELPVGLTKDQIENSPEIQEDMPVSRQKELELVQYYGWPEYWAGPGSYITGSNPMPPYMPDKAKKEIEEMQKQEEKEQDSHLRDCDEVEGYNIKAVDDSIGHVQDFVFDDDSWQISYIVIDTRDFFPGGKKVIVSISWIKSIDWNLREVKVDLPKDKIEDSPEWNPSEPMSRDFEDTLYEHFKKDKYWVK